MARNGRRRRMKKVNLVLEGRPITKKNSQIPIITKTGKRFIIQSKQYRQYEEDCLRQLDFLYHGQPLTGRIHLEAYYHMPTLAKPDLLNLLAATSDILEKAKVIENDKLIYSVDGSRVMEKDKDNPRVEIFLSVC